VFEPPPSIAKSYHYYGCYSNVNRGKRKQAEEHTEHAAPEGIVEIAPPPGSALIALWPLFFRSEEPRLWAIVQARLLMVPALAWPQSLGPVYRVWMVLGEA